MFHILKFLHIKILKKKHSCTIWHFTTSKYKKFLQKIVHKNKSKFLDSSHRVDQLYHGLLAGSDDYGQ